MGKWVLKNPDYGDEHVFSNRDNALIGAILLKMFGMKPTDKAEDFIRPLKEKKKLERVC